MMGTSEQQGYLRTWSASQSASFSASAEKMAMGIYKSPPSAPR